MYLKPMIMRDVVLKNIYIDNSFLFNNTYRLYCSGMFCDIHNTGNSCSSTDHSLYMSVLEIIARTLCAPASQSFQPAVSEFQFPYFPDSPEA